jgi:hypothetical protein
MGHHYPRSSGYRVIPAETLLGSIARTRVVTLPPPTNRRTPHRVDGGSFSLSTLPMSKPLVRVSVATGKQHYRNAAGTNGEATDPSGLPNQYP